MNLKERMPVMGEGAVVYVASYINVSGFVFLNAAVTNVN